MTEDEALMDLKRRADEFNLHIRKPDLQHAYPMVTTHDTIQNYATLEALEVLGGEAHERGDVNPIPNWFARKEEGYKVLKRLYPILLAAKSYNARLKGCYARAAVRETELRLRDGKP